MRRGITPMGLIGLALGLAFLYLPLALLVGPILIFQRHQERSLERI